MSSVPDVDVSKTKGLKIASLNVNSLIKNIDEIRIMLINHPFDILAINKTKLDYFRLGNIHK
jgi:exonuclease III